MAYKGIWAPVILGQGGLHTDDPEPLIPPGKLTDASNMTLYGNVMTTAPSAVRLNVSPVASGVYGVFDWWPTDDIADRTTVVLGSDGQLYFINTVGQVTQVGVAFGAPPALSVTNQVWFCAGGNENPGNPRLLFIFDGVNFPQVITGTGTQRASISGPDGGWVVGTNMPGYGFIQSNCLCVMGGVGNTSIIYTSDPSSHQTFNNSEESTIGVFPGEGTGLVCHAVLGGQTFVFKSPSYMYQLTTAGASSTWFAQRSLRNVGIASAHSVAHTINDVIVKNSMDQLNSIAAVLEFGNVKSGDLLAVMRMERFMRLYTNKGGNVGTHCAYYAEKKLLYYTFRSTSGYVNDLLLEIRINPDAHSIFIPSNPPAATLHRAYAPNCMALRRDKQLVERPVYGSLDGYVYLMDQPGSTVNSVPFVSMAQTPNMDMAHVDPKLSTLTKNWDRLNVRMTPPGNWILYVDVIIDGAFYETLQISNSTATLLGDKLDPQPNDFQLGDATAPQTSDSVLSDSLDLRDVVVPLHGIGRTIKFKVYNAAGSPQFQLAGLYVGFRPAGQQASVAP